MNTDEIEIIEATEMSISAQIITNIIGSAITAVSRNVVVASSMLLRFRKYGEMLELRTRIPRRISPRTVSHEVRNSTQRGGATLSRRRDEAGSLMRSPSAEGPPVGCVDR